MWAKVRARQNEWSHASTRACLHAQRFTRAASPEEFMGLSDNLRGGLQAFCGQSCVLFPPVHVTSLQWGSCTFIDPREMVWYQRAGQNCPQCYCSSANLLL